MSDLDLEGVPAEIRSEVAKLAEAIEFDAIDGKGSQSWIFFGTDRVTGRRIAVKFYFWGDDPRLHAEPRALANLRNRHLVEIYGCGIAGGEYAWFQTPRFGGGDLDDLLVQRRPSLHGALGLASGMLEGISALHAARLLHRDVKLENVFLSDDGVAVVADLGSVRRVPEGSDGVPGSRHSPVYRPPESIRDGRYSFAGDIYQVGVCTYQLMGGHLPYDGPLWLSRKDKGPWELTTDVYEKGRIEGEAIERSILRGDVVKMDSLPPWVGAGMRRILRRATHVDPGSRFAGCAEFLSALNRERRLTLDWRIDGNGHSAPCQGGAVRLVRTPRGLWVGERDLGRGWRTSKDWKSSDAADVVAAIHATIYG